MGGAAKAIPVMAAIQAGIAVFEGTMKVVAGAAKIAIAPLNAFGTGLKELQGSLGPIGVAFAGMENVGNTLKSVGDAIPVVGKAFSVVGETMNAVNGAIRGIVESMTSLAKVANPGVFRSWQIALEDIQGVIGRMFVPVLIMMRDAVRFVGDALATMLPNSSDVAAAIQPIKEAWKSIKDSLADVIGTIGPMIRDNLIVALNMLAKMIRIVVDAHVWAINTVMKAARAFGLVGKQNGAENMQSSVGAAARAPQFTQMEEYLKQIQLAAYTIPAEEGKVSEKEVPNLVSLIKDQVDKVITLLEKFTDPKQIVQNAQSIIPDPFGIGRVMRGFN